MTSKQLILGREGAFHLGARGRKLVSEDPKRYFLGRMKYGWWEWQLQDGKGDP